MDNTTFVKIWSSSPWIRMAHITRYSSLPVLNKESVAEHSWFVCLFSLAIARHLKERYPTLDIDFAKLLERAVVHDMDEALSGDIIRPFKYADPILKQHLDRVVHSGMLKALEGYPGNPQLYAAWYAAKDDDLEGYILSVADMWSVVLYARRDLLMGNAYARRVLIEISGWLLHLREEIPNIPTWDKNGFEVLREICFQLGAFASQTGSNVEAEKANAASDLLDPYIGGKDE